MKYFFKIIKNLAIFIIFFVIIITLFKTPTVACETINHDILINQSTKDIQNHMGSKESIRYYGSLNLLIPELDIEIRLITTFFEHTSKDITFIMEFLTKLDWDSLIKTNKNLTIQLCKITNNPLKTAYYSMYDNFCLNPYMMSPFINFVTENNIEINHMKLPPFLEEDYIIILEKELQENIKGKPLTTHNDE